MPTPVYEGGGLVIPVPPSTKTFATRLRQSLQEFEKQLKDTEKPDDALEAPMVAPEATPAKTGQ